MISGLASQAVRGLMYPPQFKLFNLTKESYKINNKSKASTKYHYKKNEKNKKKVDGHPKYSAKDVEVAVTGIIRT